MSPASTQRLFALPDISIPWLAAGVVVVVTVLNMAGVQAGRRVQNTLSLTKLAGMTVLILAGLLLGRADLASPSAVAAVETDWSTAFILILYAYGGWNDAAYVVAEIRNPSQNVPRALFLGIGAVTAVYLLCNLAYLRARLRGPGALCRPPPRTRCSSLPAFMPRT